MSAPLPAATLEPRPGTVAEPMPAISVVIPCLDEAESIAECVAKARRGIAASGLPGEVLVVDNGSTDGTPELAEAAGARVVHESRRGYGSAYLRGFREARGRYLVMGDADGSYDFEDVPRFVAPLHAGDARPGHGHAAQGQHPARRHALVAPLDRQPDPLRHAAAASTAPASPTRTAACARSPARRYERMAPAHHRHGARLRDGRQRAALAAAPRRDPDHLPPARRRLQAQRAARRLAARALHAAVLALVPVPGCRGSRSAPSARCWWRCSPAGRGSCSAACGTTTRCSSAASPLILGYNLVLFDVFAKTFSMAAGTGAAAAVAGAAARRLLARARGGARRPRLRGGLGAGSEDLRRLGALGVRAADGGARHRPRHDADGDRQRRRCSPPSSSG